jgi:MFS transporter, ACS family, allantoate permease
MLIKWQLMNSMGPLLAILGLFLVRFLPPEHKVGRLVGYYLYGSSITCFMCLLSLVSSNVAGWTKKTTALTMYLMAYCAGNVSGFSTYLGSYTCFSLAFSMTIPIGHSRLFQSDASQFHTDKWQIIGPHVFQPGDRPAYHTAITVIVVSLILSYLIMIFIYLWCKRQNTIKASIRAAPGYSKIDGQEFMDLTDRENPEFVYAL